MSRLLALSGLAAWTGATLLLSLLRPVRRPRLLDRLRPYAAVATTAASGRALLSADSFRLALRPVAEVLGSRLARLTGVEEELTLRLRRVHSPMDPAAFRLRQMGVAVLAFGIAGGATFALPLPP
ncbi:hypothetical protein B7486_65255, partial [cyanobacterium TDX16]